MILAQIPVAEGSFWVQVLQLGLGGVALWWMAQVLIPKMFDELKTQREECKAEREDMLKAAREERDQFRSEREACRLRKLAP